MDSRGLRVLGVALAAGVSGCGIMGMQGATPLDSGDGGKTPVIIAQLQMVPKIEQGRISTIEVRKYTTKDAMGFWLSEERTPIDWEVEDERGWGKVFHGSPTDYWFSLKLKGVSVVPWFEGTKYIRKGTLVLRDFCAVEAVGQGCRSIGQDTLDMYRDLRVEVPPGAGAVYIGKLVLHHNGARVTKVRVEDAYDEAMAALRGQSFPGVNLKSVRKRLAVVLGAG